jgi:hypothetical protein
MVSVVLTAQIVKACGETLQFFSHLESARASCLEDGDWIGPGDEAGRLDDRPQKEHRLFVCLDISKVLTTGSAGL